MRRSRSFQKKRRRRNRGSSKTKYSIDKHQTEIRNWRNELIKVLYIVVPSPYQLNWIQIHKKTRAELNRAMGEPTVRHTPAPGNQQSWPKWTPTKLTKMNLKGSGEANRRLLIILISLAHRNNLWRPLPSAAPPDWPSPPLCTARA